MIFWRTLKKHIRTNGAVTVWLVIGVIVCAYCISVMLGMATGQYQLATRSNTEASLTIDIEDADIQAEEISAYLNDLAKNGMVNVLYFTPLKEKDILIGWEGTKGRTWFPITSGRFFDASEQETGALVGFVSDNVDQTILNQGHIVSSAWGGLYRGPLLLQNPHYQPWMYLARLMGKKQDFISYHFPDIRKNIDQDRFWLSFIMRHIKI